MQELSNTFERDDYPGKLKILFIGWPESSHTHSWIDLLQGSEINVRLFALQSVSPPDDWKVRTYITIEDFREFDPASRLRLLYPITDAGSAFERPTLEEALASTIRKWQPDIIHTLGLDAASYLYGRVRKQFNLQGIGTWVAQVRGGPELALHQFLPDYQEKIKGVLQNCDQLIADNELNYEYAVELGLSRGKISALGVVPGTGGIDITGLSSRWNLLPSERERIIVWPKAYEMPTSKALPVFEALKIAWERLNPCKIYMLWVVQPEINIWFQKILPEEIRNSCVMMPRIPREDALDLMLRARVMLAPSLADGVPNSMLEAMACGALPIVSPLETITPVVRATENVLFARNLFPEELAAALTLAMNDDELVDNAAKRNLELVRGRADRAVIGPKLETYYKELFDSVRSVPNNVFSNGSDNIAIDAGQNEPMTERNGISTHSANPDKNLSAEGFYPKVSVIMPVYNGANYLREAIDSVVGQTYKNIEIIVVNDGSKDDGQTESVALSFGDKIRYFKKENGGVATALNLGIQEMTGEYFSWLSHDDLYYPEKIETQIRLLATLADNKTILYGGYELINPASKAIGTVRPSARYPLAKLNTPLFGLLRGLVNGCTLLVHKDHFTRAGLFDPALRTTQDYALWFKMFREANIMFSEEILVRTRIHDERGTFKIPNHLDECNQLWIGFLDEITAQEMIFVEDTPYLFYTKTADFLDSTPYEAAAHHARALAQKNLDETKISVVIPFFNRIDLTLEAIDSVLRQTHTKFELLIVDDGSTENVARILDVAESDSRITYLRQKNGGPSKARNNGIRNATGDYIAFLDSDDLFVEDKLAKQLAVMKMQNCNFSHTSYLKKPFTDDSSEKISTKAFNGNIFPRIIASCGIAMPTVMLDKRLLKGTFFDESISIGEDVCAWIDLSRDNKVICLDEYLTIVRVGTETSAYNDLKQIEGFTNILNHVVKMNYIHSQEARHYTFLMVNDLNNLLRINAVRQVYGRFKSAVLISSKVKSLNADLISKSITSLKTNGLKLTITKVANYLKYLFATK